jgi:hypothetical protein
VLLAPEVSAEKLGTLRGGVSRGVLSTLAVALEVGVPSSSASVGISTTPASAADESRGGDPCGDVPDVPSLPLSVTANAGADVAEAVVAVGLAAVVVAVAVGRATVGYSDAAAAAVGGGTYESTTHKKGGTRV